MSANCPSLFSQKPVLFGGSRSLPRSAGLAPLIFAILRASHWPPVNIGCQVGADEQIATATACTPSPLNLFVVARNWAEAPAHVQALAGLASQVNYAAGGTTAPIKARYLLRSKSALVGCQAAVFFSPGPGSLAVAREALAMHIPVYAFVQDPPAPMPATAGAWSRSRFYGFTCWQFKPAQKELFKIHPF